MNTRKGTITISRPQCSDGSKHIEIRLRDDESRIQFATVKVELADFSEAVTGLGYVPVEIEFCGLGLIGKTAENKTELVCCDPWNAQERRKALKAYEVDGWHARTGDIDNPHRFGKDGVGVVFFRHTGKGIAEQDLQ